MAIGITVVNDTNHTVSCTKTIISRQAELGEVLTVTVPVALYSTYPKAYIYFIQGDGKAYVIDNNNAAFDYAAGTFTYTLGSADTMFSVDGTLGIQIVLRDAVPPDTLKEWRSRIVYVTVEGSIMATMDSVSGIIEAIGQAMLPANRVSLTDSDNRYTSTQVEGALAEIAGSGRTTETVKSAYDLANTANTNANTHIANASVHITSAERSKLAGIEAGAEVNNISDANALDLTDGGTTTLHNHDGRYVQDAGYVHTDNNYTTTEKNKLAGIESGAEVNNISDVNATDLTDGGNTTLHTHDSRYYTESEIDALLTNYEPADSTILKEIDIGISVQPYDANTVIDATYVHTDNNFTNAYETAVDNSVTHISDVVRHNNYAVGTGSDNYAVTLSPAPIAYTAGMVVSFKAPIANTGAVTLNCNGLGAIAVKKDVTGALVAGDIKSSQVVTVVYDGINFQIVSGSGGGGGGDPAQIVPLYARYTSVAETNTIAVPISGFAPADDLLGVYVNSTFILGEGNDYTLTGTDIVKTTGTWETGTIFDFVVYKNVLETTDNLTYVGFATLASYTPLEGQISWNTATGKLQEGLASGAEDILTETDLNNVLNGTTAFTAMQLDTTGATPNLGEIAWDTVNLTAQIGLANGSLLQIGQELLIYAKATENIANGELVQLAGAQGDHNTIKRADHAEYSLNPYLVLGVATNNIASGSFGYVTWFGKVNDVYTNGLSLFDPLWADPAVIGGMTKTEPTPPNARIKIGSVVKVATGSAENGKIAVRPFFMPKLGDLQNVYTNGTTDGQLLTYVSANSRWEAKDAPSGGQYYGTAEVKAISYNARSIAENIAIPANASCMSVGPITVETGYTVTSGDGSRWVIL